MPKALVFAPLRNMPGRRDATGAFHPEAHAFLKALSLTGPIRFFDNGTTRPFDERRADCEHWLDQETEVGIVAFFCHGWKDGIQAGWKRGNVHKLAASLAHTCAQNPVVLLYACDAGRDADNDERDDLEPGPGGEGGFADMLRDECRKIGLRATIYAHASEGHTTWNPYVRVFLPDEAAGGRWMVDPGGERTSDAVVKAPLWGEWRRAMRNTGLRFRFPFMSAAEIEAELRGRRT